MRIKAARYLGVAPWELARQPYAWMNWALTAQAAEIEAENTPPPETQGMNDGD